MWNLDADALDIALITVAKVVVAVLLKLADCARSAIIIAIAAGEDDSLAHIPEV